MYLIDDLKFDHGNSDWRLGQPQDRLTDDRFTTTSMERFEEHHLSLRSLRALPRM
jgi:hypothetical protein